MVCTSMHCSMRLMRTSVGERKRRTNWQFKRGKAATSQHLAIQGRESGNVAPLGSPIFCFVFCWLLSSWPSHFHLGPAQGTPRAQCLIMKTALHGYLESLCRASWQLLTGIWRRSLRQGSALSSF